MMNFCVYLGILGLPIQEVVLHACGKDVRFRFVDIVEVS